MRSAPRKLSTEDALYAAALRALARRAYSVFEMRTYLERRAEDKTVARTIVARLRTEELIDDARYAFEFARGRVNFRKQGRYRIVRELRQRGVPDPHIDTTIEQVFADTDEAQLVRKIIERRQRAARGPFDQKKMASLYRTLLHAGFDTSLVRRELQASKLADVLPNLDLPEPESLEDS